jgi:hypothetical protein
MLGAIWRALLRWLLGRSETAQADTAAITRDKDAAHAVEHVEAAPPASEPAVAGRLRDGSF